MVGLSQAEVLGMERRGLMGDELEKWWERTWVDRSEEEVVTWLWTTEGK